MRIKDRLYYYEFALTRIIDGDTIEGVLDRGHKKREHDVQLRLANFNAPEKRGASKEEGDAATEYLTQLLSGKKLIVRTIKTDNFSRYVGRLYAVDEENDVDLDIAEVMIEAKHAVPFMVSINL